MFRHTPPILLHIVYILAVGIAILWWYADVLVRLARKVFPAHDLASNSLVVALAFLLSTTTAAACITLFTWPLVRLKTRAGRSRPVGGEDTRVG